jgi:hypothetical protein
MRVAERAAAARATARVVDVEAVGWTEAPRVAVHTVTETWAAAWATVAAAAQWVGVQAAEVARWTCV